MNKLTIWIIGTVVALMTFATAATIAATPSNTSTGTCFDGSRYQLTLVRSGNKVDSNLVVQPTVKNSTWVVNYAYLPQNQVSHQFVKSDKRGKLVAKATFFTEAKTGVLIFTDNAGTMYCAIYGEI